MEKIALIMNGGSRNMVISDKTVARLKTLGEVVINEGSTGKEDVIKAISGATVAITSWGNTGIDAEILAACPDLKLVCHAAGSVKPIVTDALWKKGVRVVSSACPLGHGVAETALGFTISASKNFYNLNASLHNGGWEEGKDAIGDLFDLTVGVISAGLGGRALHRAFAEFAKDIRLPCCCYDPFVSDERAAALGCKKASLEELLRASDIVSIHAPSIPETYHMFNEETIGMMKDDAVLINTARGSLIDEQALYAHMKAGKLKYACLDVTDPEPPAADNPLRTLPNCIMTPHLAGLANNGLKRIGAFVCDEIERFLKGEKLVAEVTEDMLARMA